MVVWVMWELFIISPGVSLRRERVSLVSPKAPTKDSLSLLWSAYDGP